jgi:hypothetical protein
MSGVLYYYLYYVRIVVRCGFLVKLYSRQYLLVCSVDTFCD